jgi:hypothetical protein
MTSNLSDAFTSAYTLAYTARVAQGNVVGEGSAPFRAVFSALVAGAQRWADTLSDRHTDRYELLTVSPITPSPSLEISHPLGLAHQVERALHNFQILLAALRIPYLDDPLTLAVLTEVQREAAHLSRTLSAQMG